MTRAEAHAQRVRLRLEQCTGTAERPPCPNLTGKKPLEKCVLCGCFMRAKTQIPGSKCPDGRW